MKGGFAMQPTKRNVNLILSFIFAFSALALLIALAAMLPALLEFYTELMQKTSDLSSPARTSSLVLLYAVLFVALAADILLLALLILVEKKKIFSQSAVRILTVIPICCFAEAILFSVLGMFFLISFLLSFAALFLGFVLLVVRGVIAEAAQIKAENDFTV